MIVALMIFSSQVLRLTTTIATTTATASSETTDMELEDKSIKQELEPIETEEEIVEEDNMVKQEEDEEEEQENNNDDDTAETGLEEGDIMIEDNYYSSDGEDDVPLELPFDNPIPFP